MNVTISTFLSKVNHINFLLPVNMDIWARTDPTQLDVCHTNNDQCRKWSLSPDTRLVASPS